MKRILLLGALLAACSGPARTIIVNGREVNYDDAANDVLRRGKQALEGGRTDEALKAFREVIERFGQSAATDEARLRQGQALVRAGRLQEAQAKLIELLEKHPNTSFKKEAALELSAVQTKLGNTQEAAEAMKTAVSQMSEAEKQQAARSIAEAYAKTGEPAWTYALPGANQVLGQDVFLGLLVFTSITGGFMGLLGDRIRGRDVAIGGTLDIIQDLNSITDTYVFGPNVVNQARFGFSRLRVTSVPEEPFTAAQLGINNPLKNLFPGMPTITVTGLFTTGSSPFADQSSRINAFTVGDTVSIISGRHRFRVGGEYRRSQVNFYFNAFSRGQIGLGAASATIMLATVAAIVVPYLYSELRSRK